jgi:hypothetical protein
VKVHNVVMLGWKDPVIHGPRYNKAMTQLPVAFTLYLTHARIEGIIPMGYPFETSVPRIFWWVVPPWGRYAKGVCLHDYLYETQMAGQDGADSAFRIVMKQDGVKPWRRWIIYQAVHWFGKRKFRKNVKK